MRAEDMFIASFHEGDRDVGMKKLRIPTQVCILNIWSILLNDTGFISLQYTIFLNMFQITFFSLILLFFLVLFLFYYFNM